MSAHGPEFFETKMGRQFYERDVPRLLDTLERILEALEAREARGREKETP